MLESLIDDRTKILLVNNPSNPCGSVYSKEHLAALAAIALKYKLVILADEIYGNITFKGFDFHPMAAITTEVPVITVSGIAKEFLVPGWRVGWIIVHDTDDILKEVKAGMIRLSQLTIGANVPIQGAIPSILTPTRGSADEAALKAFHTATMKQLEDNAMFTVEQLSKVKGLNVVIPQGAMYVMVGVDVETAFDPASGMKNDVDFAQKLLLEENVFVLPGKCFGVDNFFRVVFTAPKDKLAEAYARIALFCERHARK